MDYPTLVRQPKWVLQSASADRPGPDQLSDEPDANAMEAWNIIKPGWKALRAGDTHEAKRHWSDAIKMQPNNLLLMRAVNQYAPELLEQGHISRLGGPWGCQIAVLIPGELRCIQNNYTFFKTLSRHTDIFICTTKPFANAAKKLAATKFQILNSEPEHPVGAMQQWHKLASTLSMVEAHERFKGRRYTHIIKLRSDFHHVQPRNLLRELVHAEGLICSSDKVFGGSRELMMLFKGFYTAIQGWFDQKEQRYWPINVDAILKSDDSCKWYGMNFPKQLVGQPATVEKLRETLISGGDELSKALQQWRIPEYREKTNTPSLYMNQLHRLVSGHPRFASEVCFARFLNFNGIQAHNSPGLLGFLRSDRRER